MADFNEDVIRIINRKDKAIQTAEQRLFNKLDPTNQRVFAAVKKLVNEMNVAGGKIEFDDQNIDIASQIDKTIIQAIQSSEMPSAIAEFLRDFDTIKKFNFDIHKDVNDLSEKELEDLISPVQKTAVQNTLDGLTGSGVNANFVEPIRQGLFQNIAAGTTKSDLETYLTNYILGNPNVDGLYSRYVKQVSRDALNQFDGQVNSRIAEEFDLDAFRYVGSLIDDSRPQCIRWVKKRILQKSDLESEIGWASNNGSGMIAGTNAENFAVFRGGYNCRHSAVPFKLTASQKKRLEDPEVLKAEEEQTRKEIQSEFVLKTPEQIEKFVKNSYYKQDFFHVTTFDNQKSIRKNGFSGEKTTIGKYFGDGIYLTDQQSVSKEYKQLYEEKNLDTVVMKLKVNIKKPFVFDNAQIRQFRIDDPELNINEASDKYENLLFEKYPQLKKTFEKNYEEISKNWDSNYKIYNQIEDAKERQSFYLKNLSRNRYFESLRKSAEELGFDSFFFLDDQFDVQGGQQIIIFNPENIKEVQ